jgi:hypothetical protein
MENVASYLCNSAKAQVDPTDASYIREDYGPNMKKTWK